MSGITVVVLCNMGWKAELFLQVTSLCTTTGVCVGKIGGGGGEGTRVRKLKYGEKNKELCD